MKKIFTQLTLLAAIVLVFSQCNKKDELTSEPVEDYMNLQVGKYIIYRLDSMKFVNLDTAKASYQAKDEIDGTLTDNLGRPSFRVVRYLRDLAGTQPWKESMTYMITVDKSNKGTIEVTENNFRYVKLQQPINEGFSWKGNNYISLYSSDPDWDYRFLDDWDYFYENVGQSYTTLSGNVENTLTVNQRDEELGYPDDPLGYSERNFAYEVYGKGIGLIYKDFLHMQYQPATGGNPAYRLGFSIKLNMISHN
ncbi:MAG TPA: hypothetical protein VEB42_10075 [Chitinophagaceae bacterium]|nr:hypothetical protein [Chitinophagaceae bacterium]